MTAFNAQGCVLKRGDGGGVEVFTSIGEVRSFDGPNGSVTILDATSLGDTYKQKLAGTVDEGQITFTMWLDPADTAQTGLRTDRAAGTLRNFQLLLDDTDTTQLAFAAYVVDFSISGSVDGVVEASCTLDISGAVTWS